jgi:heptosyltransferase-2
MTDLELDPDLFTVALLPGAEYGPAKQWPANHCAALVKQVAAAGAQTWLFGSAKDRPFAQNIIALAGGVGTNLCGNTKIADAVDLIARADVAVANDSGLMHIAAAVGTRVVAIYGSSSPEFTPPLSDNTVINWLALDCSPCFKRHCRFGHYNCLNNISAETVFGQLGIDN